MTLPALAWGETAGPADAPLLVLGCSLGTSRVLWETVLPLLTTSIRVATWDLPGHGNSPPARHAFSVGDLADAVSRRVAEPFAYAGVSLGGAVGLELALRGAVTSAGIICSGARIGTPESWHDRARQVRNQGTSSLVSASAGRWFAEGTIASAPRQTGRILHELAEADDESYARCCDALADFDVRSQLGGIDVPCLVAWGEHDPVVGVAEAHELADGIPHAAVARVPGASHLAPVDAPHEIAQLLLALVAGQEENSHVR